MGRNLKCLISLFLPVVCQNRPHLRNVRSHFTLLCSHSSLCCMLNIFFGKQKRSPFATQTTYSKNISCVCCHDSGVVVQVSIFCRRALLPCSVWKNVSGTVYKTTCKSVPNNETKIPSTKEQPVLAFTRFF